MAIREKYTSVIDVVQDWHDRIVRVESLRSQIENARRRIEALNQTIDIYQHDMDTTAAEEAQLSSIMRQFATSVSWTTFINAAIQAGKQGQ